MTNVNPQRRTKRKQKPRKLLRWFCSTSFFRLSRLSEVAKKNQHTRWQIQAESVYKHPFFVCCCLSTLRPSANVRYGARFLGYHLRQSEKNESTLFNKPLTSSVTHRDRNRNADSECQKRGLSLLRVAFILIVYSCWRAFKSSPSVSSVLFRCLFCVFLYLIGVCFFFFS